jgi:hypothetical protein
MLMEGCLPFYWLILEIHPMNKVEAQNYCRQQLLRASSTLIPTTHSHLEVRSSRAVTGGPVARRPDRGPGRAGRKYSCCGRARHGSPDKSLTGCSRPSIKFSARETEKYINPTKILHSFCYMENNSA